MAGKTGVIYLLKDRFQMFSPFLRQVVELRFPPDTVLDSDILSEEKFDTLIKTFLTNGKIPASNLIIILSDNAYFVKDFMLPAPPKNQPQPLQPPITMETLSVMSLDFIEHVPYENVVSKTFPLKDGLKVCAVNKDFFEAVKSSFEKLGFTIDGIYPGLVLGNNLSTKPFLDPTIVSTALQKAQSLKQYDLLTAEIYKPVAKVGTETTNDMELEDFAEKHKKPDKRRLYVMVGVFGVLLIILAIVYQNSMSEPAAQPQPTPKVAAAKPTTAPTVPAEVSPIDKPDGPVVDPEEAKLLTLQLTNTSAPAISVEKLRTTLGKFGFASMTTQSQPSLSASQTIIIFSILPSQQMRAAVLTEVKKVTPNVQVQEKTDASSDITILLGK